MVKPVILLLMGPFNKFNCSRYQCSSERFSLTLKYMENWWDFQINPRPPTAFSLSRVGMYAFYEPESRYDIFGTPGFTLFITRDWEFINLRIATELEFRTPPGSKTYKRFFRRRESIDTITPDSSFHQNFSI